ncbi:MAG TPA: PA2169 family four-helix-bundle protein [Methylotenera sp.]|nr:PA2169 family four-helix-bundle protein [Methylotenera sp.]
MLNNEDTISTLNNLIEISKDGEEGFRKAAESVDDPQLKTFFLDRSKEVKESVFELQELVRDLGGKPAESTSIGGYLHRRWIDLKTAILSNDNLAVLNEVERGEDVALNAYVDAANKELPPQVVLVVLRQLTGARRNHDLVKQLRDNAELQAH